jgi:hypothetical protein
MRQQLNFVVSVIPKTTHTCDQITEAHELEKTMGEVLSDRGYHFAIAGEDMMSATAKKKVRDVRISDALKTLENAQGKDFYTVEYQNAMHVALEALREKLSPPAHWIFSGDADDYDGYYINCSKCGMQRKVYDRDYERDIPIACPHCGTPMDLAAWEYEPSQCQND